MMRPPSLFSSVLFLSALLLFSCSSTGSSDDPEGNSSSSSSLDEQSSDGTSSSSSVTGSSALSSSSLSGNSSVAGSSSSAVSGSSAVSSSSSEAGGDTEPDIEWCKTAGNCGSFTDSRDGKIYHWTKIGDQVWMMKNLNLGTRIAGSENQKDATASSVEKYCYEDDETNCNTFGGLYQWHSAMALQFSCDTVAGCTVNSPHRGICPSGWHIPSREEWATFNDWVDMDIDGSRDGDAGYALKATSGWFENNGTDTYGWTALAGGYRYDKNFKDLEKSVRWWSATEHNSERTWLRNISYNHNGFNEDGSSRDNYGNSVRCVKD